jgi:hypothetical protein
MKRLESMATQAKELETDNQSLSEELTKLNSYIKEFN